MGGSSSKSHGNASPKNARKAVGAHSVLPEDVTPYQGPKIQFLSISVPVQMQAHFVSGATAGAQAVTSNVNAYYPMINQYLGQGYNLTTFYRVPGSSQTSGFGSAVVNFEAIFHKPENHQSDTASGQLLIDKATMHLQHSHGGLLTMNVAQGTVADTSDIMNKIVHHSTQGGRLICLEINGDVTTQGMSAAMSGISSGIGVDVFFEIPPQPSPARYVYQVINVPIGIHVQMGFNPKPTVVCDWLGTLSTHLNQGWKLVEIFLDQSQQRASGFSTSGSMNSAWFFEKEAHRLHDPTPLYQGTVIEYYHKISMGFTGVKTKTDWFPVLEEMGEKGWELTCIQETPEVIREGMMKLQMKLMIFFQRPIPQQPFPQRPIPQQPFPQQPIPQQPFPQQPIPQQPFPQQPIPQQPFPQQPIPQQPFPQQSFPQQPLPPGSQPPPQEAPPPYPK